ncbi:winged helix DNA-binding protein [Cellulomonas sp. JZ18]|uniref:MarR family winged helix-turn-helix transcriptional regulator n=1 Tax=Cellulomonas sp. JZ18 TaxID=2654191 RepID=UPI0012D40B13|nr:MarR family transcriptional regulator [Cellulomonas sp. JZ18]QGQ20026.1 winged helix DNA-binding protein [Cellulomonas sp. JZ18]
MSDRLVPTLHHLVDALDDYADRLLATHRYEVTFNQVVFLAVLQDVQPQDVTRLAECLGVSKAAVSKRVPGLVARGLVASGADPRNARRVVLSLTAEGARVVHEASELLDRELGRLFAGRDGLDVARTHADLRTMLELVRAQDADR